MSKRPYTQTELAVELERYYERRREVNTPAEKAAWETDEVFIALALTLWPVGMEQVAHGGYKSNSPRMRLRLRWEGFRAAADAQHRLEALLQTAEYIRGRLQPRCIPVRDP